MAPIFDCLVLEIHFVGDYSDCEVRLPSADVAQFERMIERLLQERRAVAPAELLSFFHDGGDLAQKSFLLTFDDGIRDHTINVLPILERLKLPGMFFIPGSILDPNGRLPLLERQRFIQYAYPTYRNFLDKFIVCAGDLYPEASLKRFSNQSLSEMGGYLSEYAFYTDEERYYRYVRDKLLSAEQFEAAINVLFLDRFSTDRKIMDAYYMSAQDITLLHQAGMTIGGHGYTHEHLPRMVDPRQDIERGLNTLTEITGTRPTTMSYPFGSYDQKVIDLLPDFPIQMAFTTQNKVAQLDRANPYEITRRDIVMELR